MRIVSLVPSLTELVAHLAGSDHEIVGRTPWCIEPAHIKAVDVVGGTKTPNIGKILRLQADIVLMDAEENPKSAWEALTREGIEVMVSHIRSPSQVPEFARGLCHRLGTHHPFAERCESALEETIGSGGPRRAATDLAGSTHGIEWGPIWRRPPPSCRIRRAHPRGTIPCGDTIHDRRSGGRGPLCSQVNLMPSRWRKAMRLPPPAIPLRGPSRSTDRT